MFSTTASGLCVEHPGWQYPVVASIEAADSGYGDSGAIDGIQYRDEAAREITDLGSVELIQAVARQASAGKHNRAFIVVLAPVTQIPPELDKLFVCVDHDLPDHGQLEEIARGVATQDGELPAVAELARVVDAAKGLTRSKAERCAPALSSRLRQEPVREGPRQ